MDLYINRFYVVHQRLRRKKGWYRPAIVDASTDSSVEASCFCVNIRMPVHHNCTSTGFALHAVARDGLQSCRYNRTSGWRLPPSAVHVLVLSDRAQMMLSWRQACIEQKLLRV